MHRPPPARRRSTHAGRLRARPLTCFVLIVAAALAAQGLLGGAVKLAQGRADYLAHNGVHLVAGRGAWAAATLLVDQARPATEG